MKPIPPPDWLRSTPLFAVSHHEPLIFRRRRGRCRADEAEHFLAEHSLRNLRRLKREGVNLIRTHFFKGFGLEAERDEIKLTRELARSAHELGMLVETYIQFGSIMYETFFLEKPEARDWIQLDQDGRPMRLCYDAQSFRFLPCYNNEGWLRYMEEVVRVAVEEVGADVIAFDNYDINIAPETCHCRVCAEKFRRYLRNKYALGTRAGRERFRDRCGLTDVTYVEPPVFTRANPVASIRAVYDPLMQEWIDFVCRSKAAALYRFAAYGRSLRPDVAVNCNAMKGPADNMYLMRGVDMELVGNSTHIFSSEESHQQGVSENGVVVTRIRTYKLGRALGMPAWVASRSRSRRHNLLGLAEVAAFSQPLRLYGASIESHPVAEDAERYRRFLHQHIDLYLGSETCATVAVLRSRASLAYNMYDTYRSVILAEQTLIESKVPFDTIMDSHLDDLSKYRCLVLANVESMSDEQADGLKRYARSGGGLVVTDETGRYDQWRRSRPRGVFAGLADRAAPDEAGFSRTAYGRGRVAFLQRIEPATGPPPGVNHFGDQYWRPPKNARALLAAVTWAAGEAMPLQVEAPAAVAAELTRQWRPDRFILHLVNYDLDNPSSVRVRLQLPEGMTVAEPALLSPDGKAAGPAVVRVDDGVVTLELEKLDIYAVVRFALTQVSGGTEGVRQWELSSDVHK